MYFKLLFIQALSIFLWAYTKLFLETSREVCMRSESDHDADLFDGEIFVFQQFHCLFQPADEDEFIRADADGSLHLLEQA